jgi:thiamine pyrophosphokinase
MRVLGVLDGRDMRREKLRAWAASAEFVAAADGAADLLLSLSVHPDIVIGDMDSLRSDPSTLAVLKDDDQDLTDCDKVLQWARQAGHSDLTLINIEGDLLDHVLSTLSSCVAFGRVRIILRRGVGWVFSGRLRAATAPGRRVSLIPLTPCPTVDLSGVRWPLNRAPLEMGHRVSISNEATGDAVEANVDAGAAFLFIESQLVEMPFWDE